MKKILFFLTLFVTSNLFAVDISTTVHIPQLDGLTHDLVPSEIEYHNQNKSIGFEMNGSALEKLLADQALPPLFERTEVSRDIAQCQGKIIRRTAAYELIAQDKEWLKDQSWWCRFTRKLSRGWCRPSQKNDILAYTTLRASLPESQETLREWVFDRRRPECTESEVEEDSLKLNALAQCVSETPEKPLTTCQSYFPSTFSPATTRDQYIIALNLKSQETTHSDTQARTEVKIKEKELTEVIINPLSFKKGANWKQSVQLGNLVSSFRSPAGSLPLEFKYVISFEGNIQEKVERRSLEIPNQTVVVQNYPARVELTKKEILSFEVFSDLSEEREKVLSIQHHCRKIIDDRNMTMTDLGRFLCVDKGADLDLLAKRTQIRLAFLDQEGLKRSLTWERQAPASSCRYVRKDPWDGDPFETFECDVPGESRSEWELWLRDPSSLLKGIFNDPIYGDDTVLAFNTLLGFIPTMKGISPLKWFVTPQTRSFDIPSLSHAWLTGEDQALLEGMDLGQVQGVPISKPAE